MTNDERPGLAPGVKGELRQTVRREHLASTYGSGGLDVFSTPHMIALMEGAALGAVAPFLRAGETTVGTRVEVDHLEACPAGAEVVATAELLEVDGRWLKFAVRATAGETLLGQGIHGRAIISEERFLSKLRQKWGPRAGV
ncbi:MAG: thioesterase family protein [Chitinophagales bacterium]